MEEVKLTKDAWTYILGILTSDPKSLIAMLSTNKYFYEFRNRYSNLSYDIVAQIDTGCRGGMCESHKDKSHITFYKCNIWGQKTGVLSVYNLINRLIKTETYVKGKLHGRVITYQRYSHPSPSSITSYWNGVQQGLYISYGMYGIVFQYIYYQNGVEHGLAIERDIEYEYPCHVGYYSHGLKEGWWSIESIGEDHREYVSQSIRYDQGKKKEILKYFKGGKLKSYKCVEDDRKRNRCQFYNRDGEELKEKPIKIDKRVPLKVIFVPPTEEQMQFH